MENQVEQERKWLLNQARNVKAPPFVCLHNYYNNKPWSAASGWLWWVA